jgi:hypothetical protein
MSRCSRSAIVLGGILGLARFGATAHAKNHPTYDGVIDFGRQLLYLDDGCLSIQGTVAAGSFFQDLKRIDNGGELEYRKHGRVVKEYPESLTTSIDIMVDQSFDGSLHWPASLRHGGSLAWKFEVDWKHEMQMRRAESPAAAHCVGDSDILLPGDLPVPSVSCQMTVVSKGVPLVDHLIVLIFEADGKPLTRISFAP